jgi:hypothetical protein
MEKLDRIKDSVTNAYAKGKLPDSYYQILNNKISLSYESSYINTINSLYNEHSDDEYRSNRLGALGDEIADAYAKGKLTDSHYQILKSKISDYVE